MKNNMESMAAIITGGASGLGQAIAKKLSEANVKLALFDKNKKQLLQAQSQIKADIIVIEVDVTNETALKNAVDTTAKAFGAIQILINSAGITGITNIQSHEVELANLQSVFDVNFTGSFLTSNFTFYEILSFIINYAELCIR